MLIGYMLFSWWYNSPSRKGKRGERRVHDILMRLPDDHYILDDVVLSTDRGTTQIDHVVVSKYGVFAIETKNYRGEIYGNDKRDQWTQIIVSNVTYARKWYKTYTYVTKNRFYNPVKQSQAHFFAIKNNLPEWPDIKIVPIIVFTGSTILKEIDSRYHVIYDYDLLDTIQNYHTVYLTDDDVKKVVSLLVQRNMKGVVDNRTHVKSIHDIKAEKEYKVAAGICPKCGGTLVLRTGKYGSFYGCSNYPNCKYTTC